MLKILLTIGFLQFLTMLVLLVRAKVLAVLLGPEWVGVMAVIDKLLAVFSQMALFSMPFAALRFLPRHWKENPAEFAALLRRMRNVVTLFLLLALAGGMGVALLAPGWLGKELLPYREVVLVAFLTLPVLAFVPFLQNVFAARLEQNASMLFLLLHAAVLTAASVVGVLWNGLQGMYLLYAAAGLALVIAGIRRAERLPQDRPRAGPGPALQLPGQVWRFCLAFAALVFLAPYAALFVHYRVLSEHGAAAAGWMYAAMAIALAVRNVLGQAHAVFMTPHVNLGGDHQDRITWAAEYLKVFSLVAVLVAMPVLLFAPFAVRLLFTPEFLPAASFVAVFVMAEAIGLLAGIYQGLAVAFDHIGFHVSQNIVAQAAMMGVALLLIPEYGVLGAGIAGVACYAVMLVASMLFLRLRYNMRIPGRTVGLTLYFLVALGVAGMAGLRYPDLTLTSVALKLGVFAVLVLALALFLTRQDWANLRRLAMELTSRAQAGGTGVAG